MSQPGWRKSLVIFLIILGGSLPIALYWWILGRVPTLSAWEAIEILNRPGENVVLIDARDAKSFEARHLEMAQNWPLEQIRAVSSRDQVPAQLQDKTLLVICEVGFSSTEAVRRLQALGLNSVYNIRGGMQAWVAAWDAACTCPLCRLQSASEETGDLSFRAMPLHEQWAEIIAGFVFKPIYMVSSFVLILILRQQKSSDLGALRWGLFFFLAGELCCMVYSLYYLFFYKGSDFFEYLHGYGMVLAFGFTSYAIIEGIDTRAFKLSNPGKRCAALELCGPCIKYEDAPCGARRVFLLLMPLHIVLAAIPLFASPSTVSYNTYILETFYNYSHLFIHQLFEIRYCPILAMILIGISFIIMWRNKDRPVTTASKIFFAAGVGAFGFSMFRLLFSTVYHDNLVWFDFWEELTELLYVVATACILWIFRRNLFQRKM